MPPTRGSNLLSAMFVFILTLTLAACDLPLRNDVAGSDYAPKHGGSTLPEGGGISGICNAFDASTVLTPIPTSSSDGAPINVRIHYNRGNNTYADWGLHVWQVNDAGQYIADYPGVSWPSPLVRSGIDDYGAYFEIRATQFTNPSAAGFGFIVHPPGQNGDPCVDRVWTFTAGDEFWLPVAHHA